MMKDQSDPDSLSWWEFRKQNVSTVDEMIDSKYISEAYRSRL